MKKIFVFILISLSLLALAGCNHKDNRFAKEEILATDKAFSKLSEETGMKNAFLEYAAGEVVILRNNSYPIVGKDALALRFKNLSDTGFTLTWEPQFADVSASGELGYSYGIYTLISKDYEGNPAVEKGTYVSIWKRNKDGRWKFVLDTGNEGLGEQQ